jgi:hypothetical protein
VEPGFDEEVERVQAEVEALEGEVSRAQALSSEVKHVLAALATERSRSSSGRELPMGARYLTLSVGFALLVAGGLALDQSLGSALMVLTFGGFIWEAVR